MKNIITANKRFIRPGIAVLIIILLVAAGVSYNYFRPENHSFFRHSGERVTFNGALLQEVYKGFSSVPYYNCTEFSFKKKPGIIRVFLTGEASLSGWPYGHEQSVGRKLEQILAEYAPSVSFEVITISIAGFNSSLATEIIPQLFKYQPDIIILYTGHNEFYGYKNAVSGKDVFRLNSLRKALASAGQEDHISYDNSSDDLEMLLPLCSENIMIGSNKREFGLTVEHFRENIGRVISLCTDNRIPLVITEMSDNMLLPPVGIASMNEKKDQFDADLIFNNARMALLRDGNDNAAEKLFRQSKEMDLFRIRIPEAMLSALRNSAANLAVLAPVKQEFEAFSINHIPGTDLFADYIHPNITGLNIIASVYTRVLINRFCGSMPVPGVRELVEKQQMREQNSRNSDQLLGMKRLERSAAYLEDAGFSKMDQRDSL
ncbi:MAG: hypothetical protein ACM3Q2_08145 [Syntrophothermus sp.]